MKYLAAFGLNDLKNIRRDSLLIYMLLIPWLAVILLRTLLPAIDRWFTASYHTPVEVYFPLILSFFFVLEIPLVFGLVFGFLLLDEKDARILTALQVTPVTVENYVRYRFVSTFLFSAIYIILTLWATGLVNTYHLFRVIPVALLSGGLAIFVMLFLISFANNKVEGLALMKGMGILMLGPLVAYFWESNWQLALGLLPSYWPAKAYWMISAGDKAWPYIAMGSIYISFLVWLLLKRFNTRIKSI